MGLIEYLDGWDFAAAESLLREALRLDPSYAPAWHWYGMMLMATSRFDASIEAFDHAVTLEPTSSLFHAKRAGVVAAAGRIADAERDLRRVVERFPQSSLAHRELGYLLIGEGRVEEGLASLRRAAELLGGEDESADLAWGLARAGRRGEAKAIAARLARPSRGEYVSPLDVAVVYAGLERRRRRVPLARPRVRDPRPRPGLPRHRAGLRDAAPGSEVHRSGAQDEAGSRGAERRRPRRERATMRVLVTGHLGYIGAVMTPMLIDAGHEVVGLDTGWFRGCRFRRGARAHAGAGDRARPPLGRARRSRRLRRRRSSRQSLQRSARRHRSRAHARDQRRGDAAPGSASRATPESSASCSRRRAAATAPAATICATRIRRSRR